MEKSVKLAFENQTEGKEKTKKHSLFRKIYAGTMAVSTVAAATATTALAWDSVTVNNSVGGTDPSGMMGKILGILLTITRYVGIALVVYGVYEIVMSFMQNQPEAKTKGIVMALAGVVMAGLKSLLKTIGVVS